MNKKFGYCLFSLVFYGCSQLKSEGYLLGRGSVLPTVTAGLLATKVGAANHTAVWHLPFPFIDNSLNQRVYLLLGAGASQLTQLDYGSVLAGVFCRESAFDVSVHLQPIINLNEITWHNCRAFLWEQGKGSLKNFEVKLRFCRDHIFSPSFSFLPVHFFSDDQVDNLGGEWGFDLGPYVRLGAGFQHQLFSKNLNGYLQLTFKEAAPISALWVVKSLSSQIKLSPRAVNLPNSNAPNVPNSNAPNVPNSNAPNAPNSNAPNAPNSIQYPGSNGKGLTCAPVDSSHQGAGSASVTVEEDQKAARFEHYLKTNLHRGYFQGGVVGLLAAVKEARGLGSETLREILCKTNERGNLLLHELLAVCPNEKEVILLLKEAFKGPRGLQEAFFSLKNKGGETLFPYLSREGYLSAPRCANFEDFIKLASGTSPLDFLGLFTKNETIAYQWSIERSAFKFLLSGWKNAFNKAQGWKGAEKIEAVKALKHILKSKSGSGTESLLSAVSRRRLLHRDTSYDLKSFLEFSKSVFGEPEFAAWVSSLKDEQPVWAVCHEESWAKIKRFIGTEISLGRGRDLDYKVDCYLEGIALLNKEYFLSLPKPFQDSFFSGETTSGRCFTEYYLDLLAYDTWLTIEQANPLKVAYPTRSLEVFERLLSLMPDDVSKQQLAGAKKLSESLSRNIFREKPWKGIPYCLHLLFFGDLESKAGLLKLENNLKAANRWVNEEGLLRSVWAGLFQSNGTRDSLLEVLIKNYRFGDAGSLKRFLAKLEHIDTETKAKSSVSQGTFAEEYLLKRRSGGKHWLKKAVEQWGDVEVRRHFFSEPGDWFYAKELSTYL